MSTESLQAAAESEGTEERRMPRVQLRTPKGTLNAIQAAVEAGRFCDRSEALRDAIREKFMEPRRVERFESPRPRRPSDGRLRPRGGSDRERVTLCVPTGMLAAIDEAVERGWYGNRSEAVRAAAREKFIEERA